MSYSKNIWNAVTSCTYKKAPSWGAYDDCRTTTFTGSSASNSHELAVVEISRKMYDNFIAFNFYVDGKLLKQNIHRRNSLKAGDLLRTTKSNFLNFQNQNTHNLNKAL